MTQLVLWSCLVLPFYFVKSFSKVLANWSNSQVYTTCIQSIVSLFHRSDNLNSLYPYFLLCGSVSLPSVCAFGPTDLMSQFSLYTYFLLRSCMSWFHCSGGFSGFLDRRYGLQCPLLHQLKFPFESIASPSRPKHRRRRWYHRHYHRRVKFLHHPRPKLVKPVSLQISRSRKSVCRSAIAVLSRVTNFAFRSCPSFLLRLPGLPVILACVSHYLQSSFILRACCTYFSACYIFTTCYLAWCSRSHPFLHVFNFDNDADFGSELPFSVQEGELSNVGPSKVYSDRVENALLDIFCCIMAQSRAAQSQSISQSWESVNPPRRHSFAVPDLASFVSTFDPLANSKVLLEEEWHDLSVNTASATTYLNPVPNLDHFVRNIDPLLHF